LASYSKQKKHGALKSNLTALNLSASHLAVDAIVAVPFVIPRGEIHQIFLLSSKLSSERLWIRKTLIKFNLLWSCNQNIPIEKN
jgi:hypothetical protein